MFMANVGSLNIPYMDTILFMFKRQPWRTLPPWSSPAASWRLATDILNYESSFNIGTPLKINMNIIMEVWKIMFLSKWVICRFHVNLAGCNIISLLTLFSTCCVNFLLKWTRFVLSFIQWSTESSGKQWALEAHPAMPWRFIRGPHPAMKCHGLVGKLAYISGTSSIFSWNIPATWWIHSVAVLVYRALSWETCTK